MRNDRGITLIELLAVIVIFGVIITLIISVLLNGMSASKRNTTNQRIQQEANKIVELIRKEYLKNEPGEITLVVEDKGDSQMLIMFKGEENEVKISEGYYYCESTDEECETVIIPEISRNNNEILHMVLTDRKGDKSLSYEINTTFSRLH